MKKLTICCSILLAFGVVFSAAAVVTQAVATSGKIKAKASKDGEDILSSMLEQSVNAVLTVALRK
jgi:hypothetical protein